MKVLAVERRLINLRGECHGRPARLHDADSWLTLAVLASRAYQLVGDSDFVIFRVNEIEYRFEMVDWKIWFILLVITEKYLIQWFYTYIVYFILGPFRYWQFTVLQKKSNLILKTLCFICILTILILNIIHILDSAW